WHQSWETRVDELANQLASQLRPGEDVLSAARALALRELRARPAAAVRAEIKSFVKLALDHSAGPRLPLSGSRTSRPGCSHDSFCVKAPLRGSSRWYGYPFLCCGQA